MAAGKENMNCTKEMKKVHIPVNTAEGHSAVLLRWLECVVHGILMAAGKDTIARLSN